MSTMSQLKSFKRFRSLKELLTNIEPSSRPQGGATEHVNWRRNEWSNVLFLTSPIFSVHPDNRRGFIWRDRGSRNNPAFVHERCRFGGGGVLVYGGISIDGRIEPHIIRDGPLTAADIGIGSSDLL
ncbi:transposable element Tcb2 transposase [Trichonephila clavipes]|nr:transposable element Tcb2 transposase [Trichonephila clavipes]